MAVVHFLISFFGKLIIGAAAVSAAITVSELIRYAFCRRDDRS